MKPGSIPEDSPLTEEDIASLVREDNKMWSIGIDPDGDPIEIMVELDRRLKEYREKLRRKA